MKTIILVGLLSCLSFGMHGMSQEEVFGSARWIGSDTPSVHPQSLTAFCLEWTISDDDQWVKFGGGDQRLTNRYRNIWHLESATDSIYIKVASDMTHRRLDFITCGMSAKPDSASLYVESLSGGERSRVKLQIGYGFTEVFIDEQHVGNINLNPMMGRMLPAKWKTGDFIAYPCLGNVTCSKGVEDFRVTNYAYPYNQLSYSNVSPPVLRTHWIQRGAPVKATLTATARGVYDAYVNGQLIAPEQYFNPGLSQYDCTHFYQTFDVTNMIQEGRNDLYFALGEGWWSGPATFGPEGWNAFGDRQSLICRLMIESDNGEIVEIVSNPKDWEVASDGPRSLASFFQGEVLDGRQSLFDGIWSRAKIIGIDGVVGSNLDFDHIEFLPQIDPHIQPIDTIEAKGVTEVRPGIWVYDFGQNAAAIPHLTLRDMDANTELTLRYAEVLYPNLDKYGNLQGEMLLENIRAAHAQDAYICRGDSIEVFSPRMTLHGYRYMEISGLDHPLPLRDVKMIPLSSLQQETASFECSNELVNKLWQNIYWSMRSNFMSIPTDCPQRNERLGWSGDINVFSHSAVYLGDVEDFLRKHLQALRDTQTPEGRFGDVAPLRNVGFGGLLWGSAGIEVPWQCWLQWGNQEMLREHYEAMADYIAFVESNYIDQESGIMRQKYPVWGYLADWLSPEDKQNDPSLLWEAFYIHDLDVMAQISTVLGKNQESSMYASRASERRKFFYDNYIDERTALTRWSGLEPAKEGTIVDTYVSYVLPLAFDVVPDNIRGRFSDNLIRRVEGDDCALNVGFIGVGHICEVLSQLGRHDLAYRMLLREDYPSWLYSVKQGATTIWERLNSYIDGEGFTAGNAMNSFNHYSFGSVASWMIERCIGICRDIQDPGGKHFILQPASDPTGCMQWASGCYDTRYGRIESGWDIIDGHIRYQFTIPDGVTCTVKIPGIEVKEYGPGAYSLVN